MSWKKAKGMKWPDVEIQSAHEPTGVSLELLPLVTCFYTKSGSKCWQLYIRKKSLNKARLLRWFTVDCVISGILSISFNLTYGIDVKPSNSASKDAFAQLSLGGRKPG